MYCWNLPLKGDTGDTGDTGAAGAKGDQGDQGVPGPAFDSCCRAHTTTAESLPTNTKTLIPLNTVAYDDNSEIDTTNHLFKCKVAGKYSIKGCVGVPSMGNGERLQITIEINGTTICQHSGVPIAPASEWTAIYPVACDYELAVDDEVKLYAYQSGGATPITTGISATYLCVNRIK